jgi:hypothetical protein
MKQYKTEMDRTFLERDKLLKDILSIEGSIMQELNRPDATNPYIQSIIANRINERNKLADDFNMLSHLLNLPKRISPWPRQQPPQKNTIGDKIKNFFNRR